MKAGLLLFLALGVCLLAVVVPWLSLGVLVERIFGRKRALFLLLDARPCPPFSALVRSNVLRVTDRFSQVILLSHHPLYPPLDPRAGVLSLLTDATNYLGEKQKDKSLPSSGFSFSGSVFYALVSACAPVKLLDAAVEFAKKQSYIFDEIPPGVLVVGKNDGTSCFQLEVEYRKWTVMEKSVPCVSNEPSQNQNVELVRGEFVLVISGEEMAFLKSLDPEFQAPLAENFFFHWKASSERLQRNISVVLHDMEVEDVDDLVVKYKEATRMQLYRSLGIKRLFRNNDHLPYISVAECSKESQRCFPSIVDDTPDYLYRNRWTPPCCLDNLRKTLQHVVQVLDAYKVRHWLEGGSLLGAVRHKDIIPWDSDVDLGIYESDMQLCPMFSAAKSSPHGGVIDSEGFLWEKAPEGDFFRVHFSVRNRLHVDIFPFRVNASGFMTKDTWFDDHVQDCPFPEEFIVPTMEMELGGVKVFGPKDPVGFLEYKFGKGVVENPQYPRPDLLQYP